MPFPTRGRCVAVHPDSVEIRDPKGTHSVPISPANHSARPGDWIEIANGKPIVLTPNRSPAQSLRWMERTLDPRRLRALAVRNQVEHAIRDFFVRQDFIETRTPLLVPCPGMEPHIRPYEARGVGGERAVYLPTSPEFAMKRLLAGGLERIFQICPAFRYEPKSTTHHPEFTILEWYRAFAGYEEIMKDTEELFAHVAGALFGSTTIIFGGCEIDVAPPWPRLRVRDLFLELAGVDLVRASDAQALHRECTRLGLATLVEDTWDDLYFRIWLNFIEPKLPADRAVFVTRYPASQAALSVIDTDPDGSRWARRFEVYAGGFELGNAFEELTDPTEQRLRFVKDMELREKIYGSDFPKSPLDEGFLDALAEGIPPSGGIAMGVDRMVMLYANEPEIDYTLWLPSSSS